MTTPIDDNDTERVPRYAIITTHNRPRELGDLVRQLGGSGVDFIVIVDNASEPPVNARLLRDVVVSTRIMVIRNDDQPPNLSQLWNVGLSAVRVIAGYEQSDRWDVAIFNDDVVLPSGWFDAVSTALRTYDVAAASGAIHTAITMPIVKTTTDRDPGGRLCPWAFVTRGELSLRADERLHWWWGDTDFDWIARQSGGIVIIPGYIAENVYANQSTVGELATQAGRDRETFHQKWGQLPW